MTNPSDKSSVLFRARRSANHPSAVARHDSLRRFFCLFLCLLTLCPSGGVLAQVETEQRPTETGTAPADPEGGKKKPRPAMIRAFIVPGEGGKGPLQFVAKPQKADVAVAPQVVAAADGAAVFSGSYQAMAPGGVIVELRSGDKALADESVALQPARAYTFVAWQASSTGWQIKAFADDPASPNAADRPVRVLNFPAGRETLLSLNGGGETKVAANRIQEFRAPLKVIGATVKVLAPDGGPPAVSDLEMDYSTLKSGYIVIVPDNLGRMRPQFIGGGYEEVQELAPSSAVVAAPVSPEEERKQRTTAARMEIDQQETILKMIKAREAAMGNSPNATLLQNRREAEKKLAELKKSLAAPESATPSAAP